MTLIECRKYYLETLKEIYSVREIDFYYKTLIQFFFKWPPTIIGLSPEKILSKKQLKLLLDSNIALSKSHPIQYLTGKSNFMGLEFNVNNFVLIPRQETEELVSWIISDNKSTFKQQKILDIGTGSGCIIISLAFYLSTSCFSAIDISKEALDVAKTNANLNNVKIKFYRKDIFRMVSLNNDIFDILVSNPPYVSPLEKENIKPNVLNFEPHEAIFVSKNNPLMFYEKILNFAIKNLNISGLIYFEINPVFYKSIINLIDSYQLFEITSRKDIFGKNRMVRLKKKHG
jgi:release factor glutamine methyltransferase